MTTQTNHPIYKLGLALSGGGAKGFAHIGVFKLLEECRLKPDITRYLRVKRRRVNGRTICRRLHSQ